MFNAIVAVDNNWGIGYNGQLLEKLSADMKYFKQRTSGENIAVIMGRKTWDSLPKKPLPNRRNIIVTRHPDSEIDNQVLQGDISQILFDVVNTHYYNSLDYFVIGGGQVYKELLPLCKYVYVTKMFVDHENVDTYFPNLDEDKNWECVYTSDVQQENDVKFQFCVYRRV